MSLVWFQESIVCDGLSIFSQRRQRADKAAAAEAKKQAIAEAQEEPEKVEFDEEGEPCMSSFL